jgi:hypothetical protein
MRMTAFFARGAQHVMSMVDSVQHDLQLSTQPLVHAEAEDLGDLVRHQSHQADVARALVQLVNRKVLAEDQIPAVLDLLDRIVPAQVDRLAIFLREFGPGQKGPVVESLLEDVGGCSTMARRDGCTRRRDAETSFRRGGSGGAAPRSRHVRSMW